MTIRFSNLSAPPTLLALKHTDFKALIDFGFVHSHSPRCNRHRFAPAGLAHAFFQSSRLLQPGEQQNAPASFPTASQKKGGSANPSNADKY